jgi:uncharacterized protein DUF6328
VKSRDDLRASGAASTKDKVQKALSEVRTLVLGAQILLGFEYRALFLPRFEDLPGYGKSLETLAFALMLITIGCLVAPSSFHRISEGGEATRRQLAYTKAMITVALVPFAVATGGNVIIATGLYVGGKAALLLGLATTAVAAFFWFGIGHMQRSKRGLQGQGGEADEKMPLSEKINALLTETRIVLPGVQALLGFQFAAYLTEAFGKLSPTAQAVHTASLLLLAFTMILLMTPAPYHRLAEDGENTTHFERVGATFVLAALVPLSLALAGDFYVVLEEALQNAQLAFFGALASVGGALGLWFAVPLLTARRTRASRATARRRF